MNHKKIHFVDNNEAAYSNVHRNSHLENELALPSKEELAYQLNQISSTYRKTNYKGSNDSINDVISSWNNVISSRKTNRPPLFDISVQKNLTDTDPSSHAIGCRKRRVTVQYNNEFNDSKIEEHSDIRISEQEEEEEDGTTGDYNDDSISIGSVVSDIISASDSESDVDQSLSDHGGNSEHPSPPGKVPRKQNLHANRIVVENISGVMGHAKTTNMR